MAKKQATINGMMKIIENYRKFDLAELLLRAFGNATQGNCCATQEKRMWGKLGGLKRIFTFFSSNSCYKITFFYKMDNLML